MRQWMMSLVAVTAFASVTAFGQSPYQSEITPTPTTIAVPGGVIKTDAPPAKTDAPPAKTDAPTSQQPVYVVNGGGYKMGCGTNSCITGTCCNTCCDPCCQTISGRVEFLNWKLRDVNTIPLVTTGSVPEAGLGAGILGQPGTTILFGGDLDQDSFDGFRLTFEYWLDCDQCTGIQASGFALENRSVVFSAGSTGAGSPVLGIPYFQANGDIEGAERVAFPGAFAGNVDARFSSQFWGAEVNCLHKVRESCNCRVHALVGLRFAQLEESLALTRQTTILEDGIAGFNGQLLATGDSLGINDDFSTRNNFYGVNLGVSGRLKYGKLSADAVGKVALGATRQKIRINGFTSVSGPGITPATTSGGLFAVGSNIGSYEEDSFSVIPEFGFTVGCDVTCNCRVFVGYTVIYWSDVARPGDQIDRSINTNQVPGSLNFGVPGGPVRPLPTLRETDFWAQGITFGVEVRY